MADDFLSQEEIDALLNDDSGPDDSDVELLTPEEIDAMGEVGNISMGTAATTLYTLLGQTVNITTPTVEVSSLKEIGEKLDFAHILIKIGYKSGIEGMNLLILKEDDVKIITDLMMGGDGTNVSDELTDLHLSAISEAMNQMVGSSSTSLSDMLGAKIDIEPPEAIQDNISEADKESLGLTNDEPLVITSFNMTIGDLIDSEIMQIMPVEVAKQMVDKLMRGVEEEVPEPEPAPVPEPVAQVQATSQPAPVSQPQSGPSVVQQPNNLPKVNAQPLEFNNFDDKSSQKYYNNDIGIIKEVPLEITVELGRTTKKISEILEVGKGTVIELNSIVGESLRVLANGKEIAKGEVVVVDENYGIRITEIITRDKIIEHI